MDTGLDLESIKARRKLPVQPTIYQQDGAATADLFKEPDKTAMYARIFKRNPLARGSIIDARSWALKNGNEPVKLFMSLAKKNKWL